MNYSTHQSNFFFIKKNSTLPEIKYPLIQKIREEYDISGDMLENVAVTFSMIDAETGLYYIANTPANLVINNNRSTYPDEVQYTLTYRFKSSQTARVGRYYGEFVIDFIPTGDGEGCGKIKLPITGHINILISDTITKTTVI